MDILSNRTIIIEHAIDLILKRTGLKPIRTEIGIKRIVISSKGMMTPPKGRMIMGKGTAIIPFSGAFIYLKSLHSEAQVVFILLRRQTIGLNTAFILINKVFLLIVRVRLNLNYVSVPGNTRLQSRCSRIPDGKLFSF